MTELTLVPAGAGAGKTWRIQKQLGAWVENREVAAGRILAVTFTEAAAAELRGRVRGELMARGRITDALEIDRSYMGTIHALGQRLLTEHAFATGRSPESRLLSEPERDLLIRMEMHRCEALAPLMEDLARFGYAWDFMSGASAEDAFRADVLKIVDLIRSLGERGASPEILEPALESLTRDYGPCEADGYALCDALHQAVEAMLNAFPDNIAQAFDGNKTAKKAFSDNHRDLRSALKPGILERDWALWQRLRCLRLSMKGSPTPAGYDALAGAVIAAADALSRHPGPLADARAHLTALVTGAQEVLEAYQSAKRHSGLIDYADMIVEAEALLRSRPEILASVLGEIDCVVIDEFQDTNPVQFALLWRLARGAGRALIVGDTKQSIMAFQGADARLSAALQETHPDAVQALDRNWRSDPRIMEVVNTLGPVLFPEGYDPLSPQRDATGETALEIIDLPGGRSDTTADCVANRLSELLDDGFRVFDKTSNTLRAARPSDIAVLCYTHSKAGAIAAALEARGLPVRIQQDGWLSSPAMRAARAALAFAADPDDHHAALTWLTLGPPRVLLEDALRSAAEGVLGTHAALEPLRALTDATDRLTVSGVVTVMFRQTRLRDWAAGLANPAQALADLARLEAEAQEFDIMAPDLRAAAGYHGCGLPVFLGWIAGQSEKTWDRHPDRDGWSASGIEVCTWHGAKGREWPVTVVAGLDKDIAERPGTPGADFAGFDDLGEVLDHAGLRYFPNFAAPETQEVFAAARRPEDEREAARELYVALTRARDRLVLALPKERSKPRERAGRMVDLLRDRAGLGTDGSNLILCGRSFPAQVVGGNPEKPEIPTHAASAVHARFGKPAPMLDAPRTQWRRSPSTLVQDALVPNFSLVTVNLALGVRDIGDAVATERGTAWHLAFRVLSQRPELADRLSDATGLPEATLTEIAEQAKALTAWLAQHGYDHLHFELPVQEVCPDGSETNAIIDCLAEGPAGLLIVDHKSGACPDPESRFAGYRPQLMEYARLAGWIRPDKPVQGIAINWMSEGTVSLCRTVIAEPA